MKNENFKMENDLAETKKAGEAPIVIADECGDTLWDAVLNQEVKACEVKDVSKNAVSLLNEINKPDPIPFS